MLPAEACGLAQHSSLHFPLRLDCTDRLPPGPHCHDKAAAWTFSSVPFSSISTSPFSTTSLSSAVSPTRHSFLTTYLFTLCRTTTHFSFFSTV
ncbi:hypothetical protein E2C01_045669 [Portunus trituberculatus]|uniref:Uncharacterized protein n=1 Tax=Portunus trituberculatus TaxID=210409 RepID=A0A5B7G326_PORTR|nr:hypothetical protein [Portunus trituberculatus]